MSALLEYRLKDEIHSTPLENGQPQTAAAIRRNVLIYRNDLIERSETFIVAQVKAMRRFQGIYCGLTCCRDGILPTDAHNAILVSEGRMQGFLKKRAFMYAGWARSWQRQCSAFAPVLMHAHFALDAAFALPLNRKLKIPLIVTIHGYDITYSDAAFRATAGGRLLLRKREALIAQTNLFVCISAFIREKAIEQGYPAAKLWVHPTGIDLDQFRPDPVVSREDLVLFVGRLVEKKGCVHLVRAMHSVQCRCPWAKLVVIGDGLLRTELEALATITLPGRFAFLGVQPVEEVRAWLHKAKVFCVPSITAKDGNTEGLGMVFCEAQATGVPVVSFASGGIAEAVVDGETGYLVPEQDEAALADRICMLLENDPLRRALSRKGRLRIQEKFDLTAQTEVLEAKYDEVLAAAS